MLDLRVGDAFFQRAGKIFDDHDGFGTRVFELKLKLTRGVQRVDINHHKAGPQNGCNRHRVLRHVWHHDGDAVTLFQSQ